MREKYDDAFEILFQKKFWPHIDGTGGFFITKIRKTRSLRVESEREKRGGTNEKLKVYRGNISPWKITE